MSHGRNTPVLGFGRDCRGIMDPLEGFFTAIARVLVKETMTMLRKIHSSLITMRLHWLQNGDVFLRVPFSSWQAKRTTDAIFGGPPVLTHTQLECDHLTPYFQILI